MFAARREDLRPALAALLGGALCLGSAWGQTTNVDLPTVSLLVLSNAAEYGEVPGAFAVVRTPPYDQALDVEYGVGGTAVDGIDYARLPGRVTIPAGAAQAVVAVQPIDDRLAEPDETVTLTLAPRDRPFSLVALPDSQYYEAGYCGGVPQMFTAQTGWIAQHRDDLNIQFVLHEGDVTDQNSLAEWQRAKAALGVLDGAVPYAITVGNHDGLMGWAAQTALFNQFFPATNYLGQPGFGGVFESNRMDNCYHFFNAGGIDWLVLSLEFGPRNAVLDWANQVLTNYPNHKVILLTHAYMYADNTLQGSSTNHLWRPTSYGRDNDGIDVWEKLVRRHPNTALAFSGHVLLNGTGRLVGTNDAGNQVFQMLANYQMNAGGGNGFLRLVTFFPAEDRMTVQSYSPYLNQWLTNSENQFAWTNLGIFPPTAPAYVIDSSLGTASLLITNDDLSHNPPDVVSVTYAGLPPVFRVRFDLPVEQASAEALTNYSLSDGTSLVSAQLSADQLTVSLTAGSNLVDGADCVLTVSGLRNAAQGVMMTNPVTWAFTYSSQFMAADFANDGLAGFMIVDEGQIAAPSDWSVQSGWLVQNSNIYGPDATAVSGRKGTFAVWNSPDALAWSNYAAEVTFRNLDDDGAGLLFRYQDRSNYYKVDLDSQRNFRKLFMVAGGVETLVASETNGYAPGQEYLLRVVVTNNLMRVRLNGSPLFGGWVTNSGPSSGTVALYSWGSQGLSFKGLKATPPFLAPHLRIRSPAPYSTYAQSNAIPITILATNADGSWPQVEILDGANSLAVMTGPPYQINWTNAPAGIRLLVVQATDNLGVMAAAKVSIRVTPTYPSPVWLENPRSQVIPAGSGALLSAAAGPATLLAYQWYFNGQPINGANSRLLYFNSVHPDQAGSYWLTASNPSYCVTGQVAVLQVTETTNSVPSYPTGFQRLSIAGFDDLRVPLLSLETDSNACVTVQAAASLSSTWDPVLKVTNSGGPFYFSDPSPGATNSAARFYRAVREF